MKNLAHTHVEVEVPGVGKVHFPKSMPPDQMKREAMRLHLIAKHGRDLPISRIKNITNMMK